MLAGTCTFCASRYCLKKCCGHAWTQQHKVAAAAENRRCHRKLCSFQATINPTPSFSLLPQLSRHCQPYRALSSQQSHQQNEKKNPSEGSICRRQWKKKKHDSSAKKRTSSKRQTPSKVKVCPLKSVSAAAFCGYEASWMHCQVLLDKAYGSEINIPFCKRARRHFLLLAHYLTLT